MAISTYSELQTAVANWLDRDDLTARIPEFIVLAEARYNRELRIRGMETIVDISTVAGTRSYALPTGYLQARTLQLTTDPITPLEYLAPEMMDRLWAGSQVGKPMNLCTTKSTPRCLMPRPRTRCLPTTQTSIFTRPFSKQNLSWLTMPEFSYGWQRLKNQSPIFKMPTLETDTLATRCES